MFFGLVILLFCASTSANNGGVDPNVVRENLIANIASFRKCYTSNPVRTSKREDTSVMLKFTIESSGRVKKADVTGKSKLSKELKACLVAGLKSISYPKPIGGGVVDVNQPMNFYPKSK